MKFEIGKCYEHTTKKQMKIIGEAKSTGYGMGDGKTLVGECAGESNFMPVGSDEAAAENWHEITEEEWMKNFS